MAWSQMTYGTYNNCDLNCGPPRLLESGTEKDMSFACFVGEVESSKRL